MNIQKKENGKIVYCDENGKPLFLYNIRMRFYLWWSGLINTAKVKIWWYKGNVKTFAWFQIRAWNALLGKEMVMGGREVRSKGGYIYKQLEISKSPVSKTECIG